MIRFVRAPLLACCAAAAFAAPASAEVTETSDSHFVTRHAVDVSAPPPEAWLTLIAPEGWWNDSHTWSADAGNLTLPPQAGACFCETIPAEDGEDAFGLEGSVEHMKVLQAVPRKVLRMRGALGPLQSEPVDGVMTITLQPIEGAAGEVAGTRIVWEYVVGGSMRFEIAQISKAVDGVIGQQALGLAEALGGPLADEADSPSAFDSAFGGNSEEAEEEDEQDAESFEEGRGR